MGRNGALVDGRITREIALIWQPQPEPKEVLVIPELNPTFRLAEIYDGIGVVPIQIGFETEELGDKSSRS